MASKRMMTAHKCFTASKEEEGNTYEGAYTSPVSCCDRREAARPQPEQSSSLSSLASEHHWHVQCSMCERHAGPNAGNCVVSPASPFIQ